MSRSFFVFFFIFVDFYFICHRKSAAEYNKKIEKNFVRTSSWKANTRHSFKRPAQKMRHLLKWHICITRVDKLATASFSLSLQSPLLTAEPVYWHRILLVFFSNLSHAHLLARFVYSAAIDS